MAVRLVALSALLILTALAGCSDGPPAGDLVAIDGTVNPEGTVMSTYVARGGGQAVPSPDPRVPDRLCPVNGNPPGVPPCIEASSTYTFHFMSLPEPSGDGYSIFQMGGAIGEHSLGNLVSNNGMWEGNFSRDADETGQFDHFELRLGTSYTVASASAAAGSQAFVASPTLSAVKVTGSYKGHTLKLDVQGLPEGLKPEPVGRLYLRNADGNLSAPQETFPIVPGAQEYTSKDSNIGTFAEFHIHVGTSKIYLYQGKLD